LNFSMSFSTSSMKHGALGVPNLETMARAAGLLGERQRISNAKVFKRAKESLGIKSVRSGFGTGGGWQEAPAAGEATSEIASAPAALAAARARPQSHPTRPVALT
jgi:hypothetical protein